jgi:Glycosyl transferase WecG/TagA/CpsF family
LRWHARSRLRVGRQMSRDQMIDKVNASEADFLAVSLGAKKGQLWLHRNHQRLAIPVRAHLGAAINFQAGTVKRAPPRLRAWGLEWLWRIKEEPQLWRRYGHDGWGSCCVSLSPASCRLPSPTDGIGSSPSASRRTCRSRSRKIKIPPQSACPVMLSIGTSKRPSRASRKP